MVKSDALKIVENKFHGTILKILSGVIATHDTWPMRRAEIPLVRPLPPAHSAWGSGEGFSRSGMGYVLCLVFGQ